MILDHQGFLVILVILDKGEILVIQVPQGNLVPQGEQVVSVLVQRDLIQRPQVASRVKLVHREEEDLLDHQEDVVQLDLLAKEDRLVPLENRDHVEETANQEALDLQDEMDLMVNQERRERLVVPVSKGHRALLVSLVYQVTQDSKETKDL